MSKTFIVSENLDVRDENTTMAAMNCINGQINKDVCSVLMYQCESSPVSLRKSVIGPDGFLAAHRASGVVCIYVTAGSGFCSLIREDGQEACRVALAADEMIVFEENMPLHSYSAGVDGLEYLAVSIPQS